MHCITSTIEDHFILELQKQYKKHLITVVCFKNFYLCFAA